MTDSITSLARLARKRTPLDSSLVAIFSAGPLHAAQLDATKTACLVQRALLVALDRDSEQRMRFLRRRWQGRDAPFDQPARCHGVVIGAR